jgi:hypothetical protein
MTTELTQPQPEVGPAPDNGQAPSQGHRRRRRRRKNKSSQQNAPQAPAGPACNSPRLSNRRSSPSPSRLRLRRRNRSRRSTRTSRARKRSSSRRAPRRPLSPATASRGPPQGKRKGKQRGPREFVGPMDHSYRIVNGNVADGPPSTIQMMSNNHGSGYYPDAYSAPPPAPVREDAPTRIFCFIDDLFFQAKIQETSRKLGIKVEFVKGDKESGGAPPRSARGREAHAAGLRPEQPERQAHDPDSQVQDQAQEGHLNRRLPQSPPGRPEVKAVEAGCDTVMPRSAFSQSLPNLLRRYGMEEEEE